MGIYSNAWGNCLRARGNTLMARAVCKLVRAISKCAPPATTETLSGVVIYEHQVLVATLSGMKWPSVHDIGS